MNHRLTHSPSLFFSQSSRLSLQVKVGFTRAISSNNFIKTSSSRHFKHVRDKVYRRAEGSKQLSKPPRLSIPTRPLISCNIESRRRYIISSLKHCLLSFQAIYPHIPDRKRSLPIGGELCSLGTRVHASCAWNPRCSTKSSCFQNNLP